MGDSCLLEKAKDLKLGRPVAVKVLHKELEEPINIRE